MEYKTSPFEPIRWFDTPMVGLTQLLEGEVTGESIRNLALPSRRAFLTPEQQSSLVEDLKDKYGGDNRLLRTGIGIMTNPWIWLGAVVSPAGARNIKQVGSIFGAGARQTAKGIKSKSAIMQSLGALTTHQLLNGTPLGSAIQLDVALQTKAKDLNRKLFEETFINYYKNNPGVLHKMGVVDPPKDLDTWMAVVAKKLKLKHPKKFTKRIFNANYEGTFKSVAFDIAKTLALAGDRASETLIHIVPKWEPKATIGLTNEIDALKAGGTSLRDKFLAAKGKKKIFEIPFSTYERLAEENLILRSKDELKKWDLAISKSEGGFVIKERKVLPIISPKALANLIERYHLEPLIQAQRTTYNNRLVELMGDADEFAKTGFKNAKGKFEEFVPDEDKLTTLASALDPHSRKGNVLFHSSDPGEMLSSGKLTFEGLDLLRSVVPIDEIEHAISLAKSSSERIKRFKELMKTTVGHMWRTQSYTPRNTYKLANKNLYHPKTGEAIESLVETSDAWQSLGVQNAESLSRVNRLAPRSSFSGGLHPDDYDWLIMQNSLHGANPSINKRLQYRKNNALDLIFSNADTSTSTRLRTLDGINSYDRYMKDTQEMFSRHIEHRKLDIVTGKRIPDMDIYGELVVVDNAGRGPGLPALEGSTFEDIFLKNIEWRSGGQYTEGLLPQALASEKYGATSIEDLLTRKAPNGPRGGFTLGDAMATTYAAMKNDHAKNMVREVILPHITGRKLPQHGAIRAGQIAIAEKMQNFANGWVGKQIETWGPPGREFIHTLKEMGSYENISGPLAKWLYVGFLGANMASVMLNMMQPFLHTSLYVGLDNVMLGYKDAFKEMAGYAKDRWKLGLNISEAQKAEVMIKNFKHVGEGLQGDLIGLLPDVFANIDAASFAGVKSHQKQGWGKFLSMTLPMKLFEKAELTNRLVTAHAVEHAFRRAGKAATVTPMGGWTQEAKDYYSQIVDTRRLVQETQFGGTPMNMPTAFLGEGVAGPVLSNALSRQFLSFLARAFTSFTVTGKQIHPYRYIKGTNTRFLPFTGHYGGDIARIMGTGSLIYEIGKEIGHTDLSRGLGMQPVLEVMGGGWVPPVVQMPVDLVKLALGEDLSVAQTSLPAILPGGIAAVRAMGMLPQLGSQTFLPEIANDFQRTYVDWNTTTPEGYHPIFKADGSLVNYEKPLSIVTKGLGISLENHPKAGELDGYLAKQRNIIVKMESDYMNALINNNISKARGIEEAFKKKFKLPLKISKQQWRSRLRNLQTARMERIANTIPAEYKGLYQSTIAEEHKRLGMRSEEEALAGQTSRQRTKAGATRTSPVKLNPETIAEIKKHIQQQEQEKPIEEQTFNPFKPWNK